jgi:hypothetical protein
MSNIKINLDSLNPKSFKKTVRHKVQDGDNIVRFLPPFGAEAQGSPYIKWNVIWGLIDPNSGRMRPFASSSTYEGQCPVYDYLDLLKKKLETITDEDKLKKLNEFISALRPKSVYAYNASDKSGQVGVLELKTTAHRKVIGLMSQYITDYNQDPTSLSNEATDSGVWFNVQRAGKGFDTTYDAKKNQTMVKDENNVPSFQDDRSPLAENIVQNFDTVAYDLTTIYQKLSYDELKDILIANLAHASEDLPEILLPGFGLEEAGEIAGETAVESTPEVVQGAGSVNLNLGAESGTNATKTSAGTAAVSDADEILAMADDIFNS